MVKHTQAIRRQFSGELLSVFNYFVGLTLQKSSFTDVSQGLKYACVLQAIDITKSIQFDHQTICVHGKYRIVSKFGFYYCIKQIKPN